MRRAYNIVLTLLLVASAPFYLLRMWYRGGWRQGFRQRFGRYDAKLKQSLTNRNVLWLHLSGAKEASLCTHLIRSLEQRLPNVKIMASTASTRTARLLRYRLPSHIGRIYSPLDRRAWVVRALATINPEAIVLIEPELWPNFLWRARQRGTPVFLASSRLSPRVRLFCRLLPFLYRPLFAGLAGVSVQTEREQARMVALGCRPERVRVVGSLKLGPTRLHERRRLDVQAMLGQLGVSIEAPLLVCTSTHAPDEEILAKAFVRLREAFPDLFIVIAPERIERSRELGTLLKVRGLKAVFRNEVVNHTQFRPGDVDCLVLNTTGETEHFYGRSTICFVSQAGPASSDQNAMEPAALGKPILLGPDPGARRELPRALLEAGGAIQARDEAELHQAVSSLLTDRARCGLVAERARQVAHDWLGAVERITDMIVEKLDSDLYVAPKQ